MRQFQAAARRIAELKLIYRQMKDKQREDDSWHWLIMGQIKEMELELEEVQRKNGRRAGWPLIKNVSNVFTPIKPV